MINHRLQLSQIFVDPASRTAILFSPKVLSSQLKHIHHKGRKRFAPQCGLFPNGGRILQKYEPRNLAAVADFILRPRRYAAYGFVRNPYARLYSAWRNKFHDPFEAHPGEDRFPPRIRREIAPLRQFAGSEGLPGAGAGERVPFQTFARYVAAQRGRMNSHWDHQHLILQTPHAPHMRLIQIETGLEAGAVEAFGRLGFHADWVRRKLARPINQSSAARANPYDQALADLVFGAFEADFQRLGYARDSWTDRAPLSVENGGQTRL